MCINKDNVGCPFPFTTTMKFHSLIFVGIQSVSYYATETFPPHCRVFLGNAQKVIISNTEIEKEL